MARVVKGTKVVPHDDDTLIISDSEDAGNLKEIALGNMTIKRVELTDKTDKVRTYTIYRTNTGNLSDDIIGTFQVQDGQDGSGTTIPDWSLTKEYVESEMVYHNSGLYRARTDSIGAVPGEDVINWEFLGETEPFVVSKGYAIGDIIRHGGTLLRAVNTVVANQPFDAADWIGLYESFVGATAVDVGVAGAVPAPAAGEERHVLLGDGTWTDQVIVEQVWTDTGEYVKGDHVRDPVTKRLAQVNTDFPNGAAGYTFDELLGMTSLKLIDSEMVGATDADNGAGGLVPRPVSGEEDSFLSGDGVWKEGIPSKTFAIFTEFQPGTILKSVVDGYTVYATVRVLIPTNNTTSFTELAEKNDIVPFNHVALPRTSGDPANATRAAGLVPELPSTKTGVCILTSRGWVQDYSSTHVYYRYLGGPSGGSDAARILGVDALAGSGHSTGQTHDPMGLVSRNSSGNLVLAAGFRYRIEFSVIHDGTSLQNALYLHVNGQNMGMAAQVAASAGAWDGSNSGRGYVAVPAGSPSQEIMFRWNSVTEVNVRQVDQSSARCSGLYVSVVGLA